MLIYDRWGNKVFDADNVDACWDGIFRSVPVEAGVYVYILEMEYLDCETTRTYRKVGDVTVLR